MKKYFFIVLLSFFSICVFAQKPKMKNVDKLEVGMDMSEVKALIGNPSERSADHEVEVWIYYYMRSLIYRVTTITFDQRKVVAFETTTNDDMYKDANLSTRTNSQPIPPPISQSGTIIFPPMQDPYFGYLPPMSDAAFQQLKQYYNSETWDEGKIKILKVAALGGLFTCKQCAYFMSTKTWDEEKLAVARILLPRVIDLQNASSLHTLLNFQDSHTKLDNIIKDVSLQRGMMR